MSRRSEVAGAVGIFLFPLTVDPSPRDEEGAVGPLTGSELLIHKTMNKKKGEIYEPWPQIQSRQ